MVNVRLYTYGNEPEALDKQLTLLDTIQLNGLSEGSTVEHPKIMLPSGVRPDATYMYIDVYDRYYNIMERIPFRNNMCIITGESDVLSNFKNGIRGLRAILLRTADSRYNDKLFDDSLVETTLRVDRHNQIKKFPNEGFHVSDGEVAAGNIPFMLITNGPGGINIGGTNP